MNMGEWLVAAATVTVALGGAAACTSSGAPTTAAVPVPASASPVAGTPEWAAKWLGDPERSRNASRVVGRYARLAIVQSGGRQGDAALCDAALCDAEWAKFTPARKVVLDRDGFGEGCQVAA